MIKAIKNEKQLFDTIEGLKENVYDDEACKWSFEILKHFCKEENKLYIFIHEGYTGINFSIINSKKVLSGTIHKNELVNQSHSTGCNCYLIWEENILKIVKEVEYSLNFI